MRVQDAPADTDNTIAVMSTDEQAFLSSIDNREHFPNEGKIETLSVVIDASIVPLPDERAICHEAQILMKALREDWAYDCGCNS